MKTIEFIYQETKIHFLLQNEGEVMVNATEMSKPFKKRVRDFLRLEGTVAFIEELIELENAKIKTFDSEDLRYQNPKNVEEKDIFYTTNKATFMHRKLALKFAAWLDVKFDVWIMDQIDNILFGPYKKHWEATAKQETNKAKMKRLKIALLENPSPENVKEYFEAERQVKIAKNAKTTALRSQTRLWED
jgi:hypothetical protein